MINTQNNVFTSPSRQIAAKVELYNGSALANTFYNTDTIKSIKLSREGEAGKFFGFGVCQKAEITLTDTSRSIGIVNGDKLKVYFQEASGNGYITSFPSFYVAEVKRDENNNDINIVAYDALNGAAAHTLNELEEIPTVDWISYPAELARECATILGLEVVNPDSYAFNVEYDGTGNFSGTETLRAVFDAIAEATQTVYFVNNTDSLVFRKLSATDDNSLVITKADYFTLTTGDRKELSKIVSATELGDNLYVGDDSGAIQYVKDNPLWVLREDLPALLEEAYSNIGGISINVFDCTWRGNPALEYGDLLCLVNKNNALVFSYLLSETLDYNGGLKSSIKWEYEEDEAREAGASTTLGDVINETYAKVDKAAKQIDLVARESTANNDAIASLKITTDSIASSVSNVQSTLNEQSNELETVKLEMQSKVSAEEATLIFQKETLAGVDKVTTSTGYTFNENGLTVSKTGTQMTTTITDDGMRVNKDGNEVLTASNKGVKAIDLHATTYLIVGSNSRFEDYGEARTGCFWIGG